MAYVNAACAGRITIFSTGGKFHPGSNFTELHTLTLATCSYALLQYATLSCYVNVSNLRPRPLTLSLIMEESLEKVYVMYQDVPFTLCIPSPTFLLPASPASLPLFPSLPSFFFLLPFTFSPFSFYLSSPSFPSPHSKDCPVQHCPSDAHLV